MNIQALTGSQPVTISDEESEIRNELILDFQETREWRKRLLAKYPDDRRLSDAIEILERLIAAVADVPNVLLLLQYDQLLDTLETDQEIDSGLRAIGFKGEPYNYVCPGFYCRPTAG